MANAYAKFCAIQQLIAGKKMNSEMIINICKFVALNWICQSNYKKIKNL